MYIHSYVDKYWASWFFIESMFRCCWFWKKAQRMVVKPQMVGWLLVTVCYCRVPKEIDICVVIVFFLLVSLIKFPTCSIYWYKLMLPTQMLWHLSVGDVSTQCRCIGESLDGWNSLCWRWNKSHLFEEVFPGNAVVNIHVPYNSIHPAFSDRPKSYWAEYIILYPHYMLRGVRHKNAHVLK